MSVELIALRSATKNWLAYTKANPEATGLTDDTCARLYLDFLEHAKPEVVWEMFTIMQQQSKQSDMLMRENQRVEFERDNADAIARSWDSTNYR